MRKESWSSDRQGEEKTPDSPSRLAGFSGKTLARKRTARSIKSAWDFTRHITRTYDAYVRPPRTTVKCFIKVDGWDHNEKPFL